MCLKHKFIVDFKTVTKLLKYCNVKYNFKLNVLDINTSCNITFGLTIIYNFFRQQKCIQNHCLTWALEPFNIYKNVEKPFKTGKDLPWTNILFQLKGK